MVGEALAEGLILAGMCISIYLLGWAYVEWRDTKIASDKEDD